MDGSIRPGNPDRGWNDPPMFNYNTQAQPSPRSNLLNKRVAPPQQTTPNIGTKTASSLTSRMASAKSTSSNVSAPPKGDVPPVTSPPSAVCTSVNPSASQEDDTGLTLDQIQTVFNECEQKLQKRICDDITKKLAILREKWTNGSISNPVKVQMSKLAQALVNYQYEEAFKIHLTLMIDHVTEVSQWMVGIKRLIHEAKTIRPKLEEEVPNENNSDAPTKDETSEFKLFDTKHFQSPQPIKEITELPQDSSGNNDTEKSISQEQS